MEFLKDNSLDQGPGLHFHPYNRIGFLFPFVAEKTRTIKQGISSRIRQDGPVASKGGGSTPTFLRSPAWTHGRPNLICNSKHTHGAARTKPNPPISLPCKQQPRANPLRAAGNRLPLSGFLIARGGLFFSFLYLKKIKFQKYMTVSKNFKTISLSSPG